MIEDEPLVLNDLLPDHIRKAALSVFPDESWPFWHKYQNGKFGSVDAYRFPAAVTHALTAMLAVEPPDGFWDHDMYGSGMHLMPAGTSLGAHTDADRHPIKPWSRVGSLVYFLEDVDGGELVVNDVRYTPRKNTAIWFRGSLLHRVEECRSVRRTLSLFCWDVAEGKGGSTSAQFVDQS